MKQNTDEIIKSFNVSIGALSGRIEENSVRISDNHQAISRQKETTDSLRGGLDVIEARVRALEEKGVRTDDTHREQAQLSQQYNTARRSVRLWPIIGATDEDLWGGVGVFLHDLMGVSEDDICQDDIEDVTRADSTAGAGLVCNAVIVRSKAKKKRDIAMGCSPNLAREVDASGKPTAGTCLEIPPELKNTFRLLSQFGARLRARHGDGTKRHIKFDDYRGTLVSNIKLPGDMTWTRVTP